MAAGPRVADGGRESGLGGWSPPGARGRRSGTDERWWQWPEEGPVTTRGRGMRKEGVAGAGAGGRPRGPAVGVRDTARRGSSPKPPGPPPPRRGRARLPDLPAAGGWAGLGWRRPPKGCRLGRPPCSERQWGEDGWIRGQKGQRRRRARCTGTGPRWSAPRSRELPSAACRRSTCTWVGERLLWGDPAPGPPHLAPGRRAAEARPPVSSPVSLLRNSPSRPRDLQKTPRTVSLPRPPGPGNVASGC